MAVASADASSTVIRPMSWKNGSQLMRLLSPRAVSTAPLWAGSIDLHATRYAGTRRVLQVRDGFLVYGLPGGENFSGHRR